MQYPPRTYTAKRALEDGPMTLRKLREKLGWPSNVTAATVGMLIDTQIAERLTVPGEKRYVYRLLP